VETERHLLEAIKSGERTALRRLYERYHRYAIAIGLRYSPRFEEVEDVVQNSFVSILTTVGNFDYRGEGSLKAWVSRVVANEAINYVKQHELITFSDHIPDVVDEEEPDLEGVPPEVVSKMIGRLPPGYRLVLNLFAFEHCSHKEIAQRLGIKEDSSASQLSRAKQLLIRMINDYLRKQER